MIWFNLALFAVSFILTALFAPKPEIENARADDLDPDNFPRATEDDPIPLLFGCARIKSPNTLWYGDFNPRPITKKVKTGLFSSTRQTIGHEYFLSIQLGLCLGEARLKGIFIDGEEVNPGDLVSTTELEAIYSEVGPWAFGTGSVFEFTAPRDLAAVTGLTTTQLDTLTAAGGITWDFQWDIYGGLNSDGSPLGDGTPPDRFAIVSRWSLTSGGTSISYTPTFEVTSGGEVNRMNLRQEGVVPDGARFLELGAKFSLSLFVSDFVDVNLTDGTGPFNTISDGALTFTLRGNTTIVNVETFSINEPSLFGGREQGGGWVGNFTFYPGTIDQPVDADLEASIGAGLVPAYRGISYVHMPNNNIGETAALRRMEFLMASYTNLLGSGETVTPSSEDANPAEVLYRLITDQWTGMDIDPSFVNIDTFITAATILADENHGVSGVVSRPQDGRTVLREILRQIDGVFAENAQGQIELRLIRDDYDVGTLPIYDESDIIEISSYQRTAWSDVVSEVRVSYSQRDQESSKVAMQQNPATLDMIGRRTSELSFPFCYSDETANEICARELARLSVPIVRLTARMNRNGFSLKVGDVIKVTFPELGITELVCRVQKTNIGKLDDNKVTVELVQDIYAVNTTVFSAPVNTGWIDDRPEPVTVANSLPVEMPFFFSSNLDEPIDDGFVGYIPFAQRPQERSTGFAFTFDVETGVFGFTDPDGIDYGYHTTFNANYGDLQGFETGIDTTTGITITGLTGSNDDTLPASSAAEILAGQGGLMYANGEWMAYETVTDNMDGTLTLNNVHRGLLGTVPQDHVATNNLWFLNNALLGSGDISGALMENDTLYYVVLDQVGDTRRSTGEETEQTVVADQLIANSPLRPRNLQIDGARSEVPYGSTTPLGSVTLTWVPSNRTEDQVTGETGAAETPDQTEVYDLQVWVDGVQDVSFDATITSPHVIDLSTISGTSEAEIRIYSRRTGGDMRSSIGYAFYPITLAVTLDSTNVTLDSTTITIDRT